jgi:hypothetical protein
VLEAKIGMRTELHCLSMSTCHHLSKGWMRGAGRDRAPLGVGRPLTEPPRHRLRMVGCGLDMDHSSVGALPG